VAELNSFDRKRAEGTRRRRSVSATVNAANGATHVTRQLEQCHVRGEAAVLPSSVNAALVNKEMPQRVAKPRHCRAISVVEGCV